MQRDRYGEVIPTVARIEQAVIIAFKLPGKKDDKPTPDVGLDHLQDLGYPCKSKKRADAKNCNDGLRGYFSLAESFPHSFCDILGKFSIKFELHVFRRRKVLVSIVVRRHPLCER